MGNLVPRIDVSGPVFCVPTAISALTQKPVSKIHEILIHFYGEKKPIEGVHRHTAVSLMNTLGYDYPDWSGAQDRRDETLRFIDFLRKYGHEGSYLVFVNGHVIAVENGLFVDTIIKCPTRINGGKYKNFMFSNWKVEAWYRFEHKFKYPWSY